MAYISTEKVKEMRNKLKELFPAKKGWKLSVTTQNYSSVNCSILTAPFELRLDTTRTNESVNQYYVKEHYNDNPASKEALLSMLQVLNTNNYNNSDAQSDYFDVGHYVNLSIGKWDKPFQVLKK
jgi:hypothetical protein